MIPHAFGVGAPLALGVEEELMILDAETLDQVPAVARILESVEGLELPGAVKTELFASVFELNTHACSTAVEAGDALAELRRASAAAAAREGLAIAAAATHPFARPEDQAGLARGTGGRQHVPGNATGGCRCGDALLGQWGARVDGPYARSPRVAP